MNCIDDDIGYVFRYELRDESWDELWDELWNELWNEACVEVWQSKDAVNKQINLTEGDK